MGSFAALTIASKRYLALARVTARSFLEHHSEIPFFLLLSDEEQGRLDPAREPFRVLRMEPLGIAELRRFQFQYPELELSYASTPYAIDRLLDMGFDGVLFLKQETLVLDELSPLFERLPGHSVLLTPHFLAPPRRSDALSYELSVLRAGVFNGGVLGFAACDESRRFLSWWKTKTFRGCFRDVQNGVHFEQRWLDFAPSLAPRSHVLRDPGINIGHWNLPDRRIRVDHGRVTADGAPCRVFRFSGYDPERPEMVTRYNPRFTVESTGDAAAVFRRYHTLLAEAGHDETRRLPYAFERFDNGEVVTERMRRTYHDLGEEARRFGDPFETRRAGSFHEWFVSSAGRR